MFTTYVLMWKEFGGDSWHFDVDGKSGAYDRRDKLRQKFAADGQGGVALVLRGE